MLLHTEFLHATPEGTICLSQAYVFAAAPFGTLVLSDRKLKFSRSFLQMRVHLWGIFINFQRWIWGWKERQHLWKLGRFQSQPIPDPKAEAEKAAQTAINEDIFIKSKGDNGNKGDKGEGGGNCLLVRSLRSAESQIWVHIYIYIFRF